MPLFLYNLYMLYPQFIKKKETIGICAPSAGVGKKLDSFLLSNRALRKRGYRIRETKSVRKNSERGGSARQRGKELDELVTDRKVKMIMCAAGGDFMLEMLPYVDFEHIRENPKWICGASDPTNLLFTVTTGLDIATLYGRNGAGFTLEGNREQDEFFQIMEGDIIGQRSYRKYQEFIETISDVTTFDHDVRWISKMDKPIEGRLIGGCIDVIAKLIGTRYDRTNEFIDRYADDGIVWYFDIFSMSSYNFYMTLLQFEQAGWFRNCKGVLIGRVAFPSVEDRKLDYIKAADKALGKIPHICEMDIGHTHPNMTLINGALMKAQCRNSAGQISFRLK